jgi:hypothetical protein
MAVLLVCGMTRRKRRAFREYGGFLRYISPYYPTGGGGCQEVSEINDNLEQTGATIGKYSDKKTVSVPPFAPVADGLLR